MSYRRDKSQKRTPPNMVRYIFDTYVIDPYNNEKKRVRERIVCRKTEVHKLFAEWLEKQHSNNDRTVKLYGLFELYLDEYSQVRKTEQQYKFEVSFYNDRLKKFFENIEVNEIKRSHISQYVAWRLEQPGRFGKISHSTVNHDVNILSSFFSWCEDKELYVHKNPCRKMKLRERVRRKIRLKPEQILEIIQKSEKYGHEFQNVIMIAVYCGLRRNEIVTLRWTDIDFDTHYLYLRAEITKSDKDRCVPIPDSLYNRLLNTRRINEKVINISTDVIRYRFQKLRDELSFKDDLPVENFRFHDLRHVYAQTLRDLDVPVGDIQKFLGHASVATTELYASEGGRDGLNKVNRLNNFLHEGKKNATPVH